MKTRRLFLVAFGLAVLSIAVPGADWPQWRGPQRNGISKETGLLKEWPKEGPKLVWQVKDIGSGYSTPAIADDRIYLESNKDDEEFALALNAKDGKEVWSVKIGKVGKNKGPQYPGTRATPTVDGDLLYCLGSDGDLVCLERDKGKIRWQKNLKTDFEGKPGNWAYSESPLIDGEVLVCTPGGAKATLLALNKNTGEVIWKSEVPGGDEAAYASVAIADVGGNKEYVQFLQKGVVGVDAKTGKFLWRYDKTAENSPANIATPVVHADYVYSGASRSGGGLVKLKSEQGKVVAEPVYFNRDLPTSIGGAVLLDDYLYGTNGKGLQCVEFTTGKVKWQDKSVGAGSLCYADGRLYLHGEKGEVALVEATPEGYHEKGRFAPPDQPKRGQSQAWAYPVIANGRLYLRDLGVLWCYDVKEDQAGK
ncbi:MAG: PQQ-binding-like beta-propeller repeat protein [Gemmataceae bacterium]